MLDIDILEREKQIEAIKTLEDVKDYLTQNLFDIVNVYTESVKTSQQK